MRNMNTDQSIAAVAVCEVLNALVENKVLTEAEVISFNDTVINKVTANFKNHTLLWRSTEEFRRRIEEEQHRQMIKLAAFQPSAITETLRLLLRTFQMVVNLMALKHMLTPEEAVQTDIELNLLVWQKLTAGTDAQPGQPN